METAAERMTRAALLVDEWPEAYAAPLADLLRGEALHAADLAASGTTWDRYPADTALVAQIADGVLHEAELST